MRDAHELSVPVCTAAAVVWASKGAARVPRGSNSVPALSVFGGEAVCVWEEDGSECTVFFREGVVRDDMRKVRISTFTADGRAEFVWPLDFCLAGSISATVSATEITVGSATQYVESRVSSGQSFSSRNKELGN